MQQALQTAPQKPTALPTLFDPPFFSILCILILPFPLLVTFTTALNKGLPGMAALPEPAGATLGTAAPVNTPSLAYTAHKVTVARGVTQSVQERHVTARWQSLQAAHRCPRRRPTAA